MKKDRCWYKDQMFLLSYDGQQSTYDKVAFHLPGLPNRTVPITGITEFLCSLGYLVIQPQYSGSFDSGGKFVPEKLHEPIYKAAKLFTGRPITTLKSGDTIRVHAAAKLLLSCHSFGTFVGSNLVMGSNIFNQVIMFAPIPDFDDGATRYGNISSLTSHAEFVEKAYPRTFRVKRKGHLKKVFDGKVVPSKQSSGPKSAVPTLFVVGDQDPTIDAAKNAEGIRAYAARNENVINLIQHLIVPGAGHSVKELLSHDVKSAIQALVGGDHVGHEG